MNTVTSPFGLISQLYIGYFGRAPEPDGLGFWAKVYEGGFPLSAIAQDFATQTEALALYPELAASRPADLTGFLGDVYQNLFGRDIDAPGLAFWLSVLEAGRPIGGVILDIIEGAVGADVQVLQNKVTLAATWHDRAQQEDGFELTQAAISSSRTALALVTEDPESVASDGPATLLAEAFFNGSPTVSLAGRTLQILQDTDTTERTKVADILIADDALGINLLALSGTDADLFEIDGTELFLKSGVPSDRLNAETLSVTVEVDDPSIGSTPEDQTSLTLRITSSQVQEPEPAPPPSTPTPVNAAPTVAQQIADQSIDEDTAWSFGVPVGTFSDADGDTLTYAASLAGAALPAWLGFDAGTQVFSGTPPQDFNGVLNLTVTASDGTDSVSDTFALTVVPQNDAPIAGPLVRTTNEEVRAFEIDLRASTSDVDAGDTLSVENFVEVGSSFGSFVLNGSQLSYDASIFDALDAGESQVINFTYDIVDSAGARALTSLALTVEGRDEVIAANPDSFSTDEDTGLGGNLAVNDTPLGGVYSVVSNPIGVLNLSTSGTFTYDPSGLFDGLAAGEFTNDTFTYQIDDGLDTVTAEVTIAVHGINDVPVGAATGFAFNEDEGSVFVDLRTKWSDAESATLAFENLNVTSDNAGRTVAITEVTNSGDIIGFNLNTSIFGDLGVNEEETLTVTYNVLDGSSSTGGTSAIVIAGLNDAPVGMDETFSVLQGATVTGTFTASDVDGDAPLFSFAPAVTEGSLSVDAAGSFIYVAGIGQTADDTVTINVFDINGGVSSLEATFDIALPPTFTAPGAVQTVRTQEVDTSATNALNIGAMFTDADGGPLTFTAVEKGQTSLPAGLTINAMSGVISGTPVTNDLIRVVVTATSQFGASTSGEFWLGIVDETLTGGTSRELLTEGDFSSLIDGSGGNDSIEGGDQADIYVHNRGDGFDIIDETGFQDSDHLVLNGYASTDVVFERYAPNPFEPNGHDLVIRPAAGGFDYTQGVLVRNGLENATQTRRISEFHFDDGVTLTDVEVRAMILAQETTDGNDDIRGFDGADSLAGGLGDDVLTAGDGSDTYVFGPGDGDDTIRDSGFADTDVLQLGFNVADATPTTSVDRADLILDFGGGNRLTVVNAFGNTLTDQIEVFRFLDGDMTLAAMRNIVTAQLATTGDDLIEGTDAGDETLEGGEGDDTLVGRDGADTYVYRAGGGMDRIEDRGFLDSDTVQIHGFTIDYDHTAGEIQSGSQVTLARGIAGEAVLRTDDLVIHLDDGAGTVGQIAIIDTLTEGATNGTATIEIIDSGVTLSMADIRSDLIAQQQTAGDDLVFGFTTTDTITGGTGDDTLTGRDGTDVYVFSSGDGTDLVSDEGSGDQDRVVFTDRALSNFAIRYAPRDDGTIILSAGIDRIEIDGAVRGDEASNVEFYEFTDQTLTDAQMRQVLVDQALVLGIDLTGSLGAQIMPSSVGSDRFVSGREGSDTYTFAVGDGSDTIFDNGSGDTDTLDLTAFASTLFTSAGSGQLLLDPAVANTVVLSAGTDRLSLIDLDAFEQVQFSDQTFDNNADDADGNTNFATFVAAHGVNSKSIVQGDNTNEVFTSTFADEHFVLGGGNDDQVVFNVGQIGNDSIFKSVSTNGGYDLTIDFTGIAADTILAQSVTFSISSLDANDLIINIVHEDTSTIDPVPGIGRTDEQITIDDALAQFSGVDAISIVRESGTELIATTQELRQAILDQQVTSGDDFILGYAGNDTLSGGSGDDTLNGGSGADRYEFSIGDGKLFVTEDVDATPVDVLAISDYSILDATLSRSTFNKFDLKIGFGTDEITVSNFFRNQTEIEEFHFEAETATPDVYDIAALTVEYFEDIRSTGGDVLLGGDLANDTLDGGAGDDTLDGADGSDTYILRIGEGNDVITDTGSGDTDIVQFDVASTDVTFAQDRLDHNNFHIIMADGTDITIVNFLGDSGGDIEQFQFTDVTLTAEQARLRAFADISTAGDDHIIGSAAPDTLRGGLGDDYVSGGGDADVFLYALGDGNDTLAEDGAANSFELIQLANVSAADVEISRVPATRDPTQTSPSQSEDFLIEFANAAGSVRVNAGLSESSSAALIEIIDDGVTLTKADVIAMALQADIDAGRLTLEGPSSGGATYPSGGSFIVSQTGDDRYQFSSGDGQITILDTAPTVGTNRLEISGYASTDAFLQRVAFGAEDYFINLPNGDLILALGEISGDLPVNGINEIFFADDNVTLDNVSITAALAANDTTPIV